MTVYPLTEAPPGIALPEIWTRGEPGRIAVGDLWLLSWDGVGMGLGVVSVRLPGYVLAWPVTLSTEPSHAPAIGIGLSPLGVPVSVWPTRETGVGDALLHRRFGRLLVPQLMAAIADAIDEGDQPPLPFQPASPDPTAQRAQDDDMIDQWEAICLTQWPGPSTSTLRLDRDAASVHRLTPGRLSELLDIDTNRAVALQLGEIPLEPGQAETIATELGVAEADLMTPTREAASTALVDPVWKDDILELIARRRISEAAARDLVANEFALAARSSGSSESRLRAAFARLQAGD
jgi:hypothetical protein